MSFHLPGTSLRGGPGTCVFAPAGFRTPYRVESAEARWLVVASPAGFERFVVEAGEPACELALLRGISIDPARRDRRTARGRDSPPPGTLP